MKFHVTTIRSSGTEGEMSPEFVETFIEHLQYFQELQDEGKVVDSGIFPGQHSSYKMFKAESEDEVRSLLRKAPVSEGVEHEIEEAREVSEVKDSLRHILQKMKA